MGTLQNIVDLLSDYNPWAVREYKYTQDYVTHYARVWKTVLEPYAHLPNLRYLEVGVYEGRSLIWMLENVLTHKTSEAIAVDPYDLIVASLKWTERIFQRNLKLSGHKHKVQFFKKFSHDVLPNLPEQSFDIIYIDGNHDAIYVERDLEMALRLIKPNGLIIGDDYHYKTPPWASFDPPKVGFDKFLTRHSDLKVTFSGNQVFVKKGT